MSRPPPAFSVSMRTKIKALPAAAGKSSTKTLNRSAREESESESEDERDTPTDTSSDESDDESDTSREESSRKSENQRERKDQKKEKEKEKKEQPKKEKEKTHTPDIKSRSMPNSLESRSRAHQTNSTPPTFQDAKEKSTAKWNKSQKTQEEIASAVRQAVEAIPYWRRNLFTLPAGALGKKIAVTMTEILQKWTQKTEWEKLALDSATIFLPLILQRSGTKVNAKEAKSTIAQRLEKWNNGDIMSLLKEGQMHQERLSKKRPHETPQHRAKIFARLILQGKVRAALRMLSEGGAGGVAHSSPEVLQKLIDKHPKARDADPDALLPGHFLPVPSSLFDALNGDVIQNIAMNSKGAAGPYGMDASDMRTLLCSKRLGRAASNLCEAIADLARRLCTEFVDPASLSAFLSCRLVPLEKGSNDIRPIGIGETLRRIVGKAVTRILKPEIQKSCGNLQVCAGIEGGCEAAIHSMREMFEDDENEAALLIDATNAFNAANRCATLHNISILCPAFYTYLCNTYRKVIRLFIPAWGKEIGSFEGTTQGDPAAMPMYALSVVPLIQEGERMVHQTGHGGQVWYADDATGVAKLEALRRWWDFLKDRGPKLGYYPKAEKTVLVVKQSVHAKAREIFAETGIKIETEGTRHLGGALGTNQFMEAYATEKIKKFTQEVETLSHYAETEPQAAYAAYVHGLHGKWTFAQRVLPNTAHMYQPLEEKIRLLLIPTIIGKAPSDIERKVFALPARNGGLGIRNPEETAEENYKDSREITKPLTDLIKQQEQRNEKLNWDDYRARKRRVVAEKRAEEKKRKQEVMEKLKEQQKQQEEKKTKNNPTSVLVRSIEAASKKGTSGWLTSMPDDQHQMNKQEWRDSMAVRYGWRPKNLPQRCSCGAENSIQHAMDCKLGGFIHMRHNRVRDLFADLLRKAGCKAVQTEMQLLPDEGELEGTPKYVEKGDESRMDVTAVGFWGAWQRAYFDVRVFNPTAPSYAAQKLATLTEKHEKEKKKKYGLRIKEIEKGSFTPLVFTTTGACGKECDLALKRLSNLIAEKTGERQSAVMNYIRTEINFTLMRSCHVCLRGCRNFRAERGPREETKDFEIIEHERKLR